MGHSPTRPTRKAVYGRVGQRAAFTAAGHYKPRLPKAAAAIPRFGPPAVPRPPPVLSNPSALSEKGGEGAVAPLPAWASGLPVLTASSAAPGWFRHRRPG